MSAQRWLEFAGLAYQLAQGILPAYAHKCSPRRFTLPQLAACMLFKEYRQLDWRGLEALLALSPPLCHTLQLQRVPDYSTLWRFAQRWLGPKRLGLWLAELLRRLDLPPVNVAIDSTGLDPGRTSSYFMARQRQRRRRKRYVKLSLSVVVGPLVAASAVADWGPCNDKDRVAAVVGPNASAFEGAGIVRRRWV